MIQTFYGIEKKHDISRGEDYMKMFSESLREHAMKITNFEKKKIILLINEQQESFEKTRICYIGKKKFQHKYIHDKNCRKVKEDYHYPGKYRGAAHSICNLKCSIPKEIPVVFLNGLNHDYYFIIK